ncbi:MAG: lysylphosphatidylglycerol synthase domain-containing protein [Gammaproteobacteria bacterium]|jgi:uncharacterized membrane protein YbhN (UPF0104 family)
MTRGKAALWTIAIGSSAVLLALVIAQIDVRAARELVRATDYGWVAAGIAMLLVEGVVTALRFRLLARGAVRLRDSLLATAWYVLMLIGLPARLGEIAGIGVIARYLQQPAGVAAASLLFQRVFDMLMLIVLLAIVAALAVAGEQLFVVLSVSAALAVMFVAVVVFIEPLLTVLAVRLRHHRRQKWPRLVLRLLLQARMFSRHHMSGARLLKLGALTACKWTANLIGIALVVVAVVPAMTAATALGLGIVYNLSAVIPVQTVGGFGISEVVLLGSFRVLGYDVGVGAPIAIAIRIALISAPLLFWILALTLTAMLPRVRAAGHTS